MTPLCATVAATNAVLAVASAREWRADQRAGRAYGAAAFFCGTSLVCALWGLCSL